MHRIDNQTRKELEIFETAQGKQSILNKFDFTRTRGGRLKLKEKLLEYGNSIQEIKQKQQALLHISRHPEEWEFMLHEEEIFYLEEYFYSNISPIFSATRLDTLLQIARYQVLYKNEYAYIRGGTFRLFHFMEHIQKKLAQCIQQPLPVLLRQWTDSVQAVLEHKEIKQALRKATCNKLDFLSVIKYDCLFRVELKELIRSLFDLLYEMDALCAMAKSIRHYNLVIPEFIEAEDPVIHIQNMYHLFLQAPVPNTINFNDTHNFLFLTGPNTAGKTTLLKSCGLTLYLAHIGMGVPADSARLSYFSGIFSSISPTDNLTAGYSYFYSEVMRVKEAVSKLKDNASVFMMFDELFRGTNVKDAYDCSRLVIEGLQLWKNSIFILSTHITELASDMQQYPNVVYGYMESTVENSRPVFSYKLAPGISSERLGLLILENEKIFG
jgi:DNA mismatch repair ATPase MutS